MTPAVVPATPQQQRAVRPGRLTVAVAGPVDEERLRAATAAFGASFDVVARGEEVTITITTPPGAVDAIGLIRVWAVIAEGGRGTPAVGAVELTDYFNGLFDEPDAATAMQFWALTNAEAATTPAVLDALGTTAPGPIDKQRRRRIDISVDCGADEALMLAAWRAVLRRVAPKEEGYLGVYRPGPAAELPDAIGLLGRYVPIAVGGDDDEAPLHVIAEAMANKLTEVEPLVDFFRWPEADVDPGFRVGFRYLSISALTPLGTADVRLVALDAPLEPLVIELQVHSIAAAAAVDIVIDHDARIDERIIDQLAAWLIEVLRRPDEAPHVSMTPSSAGWRLLGESRSIKFNDVLTAVERHAAATPSAPAVAIAPNGATWNYAELMAKVRSVAAQLTADEVGDGDVVAVCMERSPLLVATLLAVTHVGAAFMPLDPSHPPGRLSELVADAAPRTVLVDASSVGLFPGVPLLRVGGEPLMIDCPPRSRLDSGTPAYVIYTSGSTGTPKGVAIGHAALSNYLAWACAEFRVAEGSGSLVHSSIAVDFTITSLMAPLVAGRTVFTLASDDPEALAAVLRSTSGLSFLKVTPSAMALLGRLLTPHELRRTARHFVLGGEQLTASARAALGDPEGTTMVTNEYGPTETTVGCCAATFGLRDPSIGPFPIGVPIWNTGIDILDAAGVPCPPGFVGELVISGAGVADGYIHRPDLTSATFRELEGGRSYHTGDRARLRVDGQLEYLGRADLQTKIHGYRVEPAEVAAVLARAPGATDAAVVVAPAQHDGVAYLSAFVVGSEVYDVRAWADDHLAPYARPDRLEIVDRLPLTSGGKIDNAALMARSRERAPAGTQSNVKDGPIAVLRQVWQAVLPGSTPDMDDGFFAAGGDSIRALHLVAGARRLGLTLTLRDVLAQRTLGRIAAAARPLEADDAGPRPPIAGPVPLSPNQRSCLRVGMAAPASWALRWRFSAPTRVSIERLDAALHVVRARHPSLRSRFRFESGAWTATIDADLGGPPPRVVEPTGLDDAVAAAAAGFSLGEGPLVELVIIDLGVDLPQALVWVASHLVVDVVSLQVLTASLWEAYAGAAAGGDDGYVAWLHAVAGEVASAGPSFADVVERRATADRLVTESVTAAAGLSQRGALVTVVTALLGAFDDVVGRPPPMCVELHGRDRADIAVDLSGAVGWFTSFAEVKRPNGDGRVVLARRPSARGSVAVNYLGDVGAGGGALGCQRFNGPVGEAAIAIFGLEVVCWIEEGILELSFRYDRAKFDDSLIERLAAALMARLSDTSGDVVATDDDRDADSARILSEFS